MKAVRIHEYGDSSVLRYEDAPMPELTDGDILIKVHTAGVNPLDWKVRQGYLQSIYSLKMPAILGWDVSGTVAATTPGVTGFALGDEVFARPEMGRDGSYAEFIAVRATDVARAPKTLSLEVAAAVPLACLTAWTALFDSADLKAGQTVLIHAGAGGVGSFAVQLAKNAGAHVIATASADGVDLVKSLGADEVIDYKVEDVSSRQGLDVVFDTVGGDTLAKSYAMVRKGGVLVTIAAMPDKAKADELGIKAAFAAVSSNGPRLGKIAQTIDEGHLRVLAVTEFPLAEAKAAQEMSAKGRTRGKIILRV